MSAPDSLFEDRDDDLTDNEPGPDSGPRRGRSREDTLAAAEQIRAAEPGISHAKIAARLGITPNYFRKIRNEKPDAAPKPVGRPKQSAKLDELSGRLLDP
ncbi:MAG: hypothetical protein ACREDE_09530, partial [Thermoplasmata archaeon]